MQNTKIGISRLKVTHIDLNNMLTFSICHIKKSHVKLQTMWRLLTTLQLLGMLTILINQKEPHLS